MDPPVKFINHEVTSSLDSSNSFEGPEKLLEIWFDQRHGIECGRGLLEVPQSAWTPMLDEVQCKILSIVSFPAIDSYVLSESSFFVYSDHLVLKTCGTTTLLDGLASILAIVKSQTSLDPEPSSVFYSRRSFLFPDRQKGCHRSWQDEVRFLKSYFPGGQSIACGSQPAERWHLFESRRKDSNQETLPTLEIMMSGLDAAACSNFFAEPSGLALTPKSPSPAPDSPSEVGAEPDDDDPGHHLGNVMTRVVGIDEIYPTKNQIVDSFAFTPCGYSCNAIVDSERFFTIHVTPEKGFSYASFGTNIVPDKFNLTNSEIINRVLSIFKPQRFEVALFDGADVDAGLPDSVPGYTSTSELIHDTESVSMWYKSFHLVHGY